MANRCLMLVSLPALWLALSGCRAPNPNPPVPHAGTAYIDFYTDTNLDLSWHIVRLEDSSGKQRTVYSELEPVSGTVLRVASLPGRYSFKIWIVNRATTGPATVEVQAEDGKVTPVHVSLVSEGTATTDRKEYRFGGSAKGYARGTKILTDTGELFRVETVAGEPQVYQQKEQMPYWLPGEKEAAP